MRGSHNDRRDFTYSLIFFIIVIMAGVLLLPPAGRIFAQVPKMSEVSVGLLFDSNGAIQDAVPEVNLSSGSGVRVGFKNGTNTVSLFQSNQAVLFSADQFSVQLLETDQYLLAKNVVEQANRGNFNAALFKIQKRGHSYYQVRVGPYKSESDAQSARSHLLLYAPIAAALRGTSPLIKGPYHWNAGTFAAFRQAQNQLNQLAAAGIEAYLVYTVNAANKPAYGVWIGNEVNTNELNVVKLNAIRAVPNLKLQPVQSNQPYILLRNELTGQNLAITPHYYFHTYNDIVTVQPLTASSVTVAERHHRSYRGSIELSVWNGEMAVLNRVSMAQYLYSVVGSELGSAPLEALKAQAVAARTYVLTRGWAYHIANVSDTTYDQAYNGIASETPDTIKAVNETSGDIVVDQSGKPIVTYYSSNAGGMTATPQEVWDSGSQSYLRSVPSPDNYAASGKPIWYHAQFSNGSIGYIDSDFASATGQTNSAGLPVYVVNGTNVNVRAAPYVDNVGNAPIFTVNSGERFIAFAQQVQSNSYSWIRGPYTSSEISDMISRYVSIHGPLASLDVTKRGASDRVTGMSANGLALSVSSPDAYRSLFDLPSTRFEIKQTGSYTILGADGQTRTVQQPVSALYAVRGSSNQALSMSDAPFVMDQKHEVRRVTKQNEYVFVGNGFGHGIGLSQWGAIGFAKLGYNYKQILQYYYFGVKIVKD